MVIYTRFTISGTEYTDIKDANVTSAMSEYDASSRLTANLDNYIGIHASDFGAGSAVDFWAAQVPLTNLKAYYNFENSTYFDEMGIGSSGLTAVGSSTGGSGVYAVSDKNGRTNSAFYFNGSSQMIINTGSGTTRLVSGQDWSIRCLFNPSSIPTTGAFGYNTIYSYNGGLLSLNSIILGVNNNGSLFVTGDDAVTTAVYGGPISVGSWYDTLITCSSGTTNLLSLYMNGVQYSGLVNAGFASFGKIILGQFTAGDKHIPSTIDELAIYNRALTGEEAQNIFNNGQSMTSCKKLFSGRIMRNTKRGQETSEDLTLTCRDYTADLKNIDVQPEIYTNQTISAIITNLMSQYAPSYITYNNVATVSTVINRVVFKQQSLFDCLTYLAQQAVGYYFFVDSYKDLHFQPKNQISSGRTLDTTNILSSNVEVNTEDVRNQIVVYGSRYYTANPTQTFTADGTGSVFTVTNQPYNVKVTASGVDKVGGVFSNTSQPSSGLNYLVSLLDKKIIFVSGTTLGYNSIPTSGSSVVINYDVSRPIIKEQDDYDSQAMYGKKSKTIIDADILDPNTAQDIATTELANSKDPVTLISTSVYGILLLYPGETVVVNLPYKNINNQTLTIIESNYNFSKNDNYWNTVLDVRLNSKIRDMSDVIKGMWNAIKKIQSTQIDEFGVISRGQTINGSAGLQGLA